MKCSVLSVSGLRRKWFFVRFRPEMKSSFYVDGAVDTLEHREMPSEASRAFAPCCCEDGGAGWRPAPERQARVERLREDPGRRSGAGLRPAYPPGAAYAASCASLMHRATTLHMNGCADSIAAPLLCLSMLQSLEHSVATHSESVVPHVCLSTHLSEAKCELLPPRPQALLRCARHRREERALTAIIVRFVTIAEF